MNVTISYKHLESTEGLESIARKKSEKLSKYFDGRLDLRWNFEVNKAGHVAHCHLTGPHADYFAEAVTESAYASIDEVIAKLERQIRRLKEKFKNHKHAA
jgi:putative sigma-54 modulation protein